MNRSIAAISEFFPEQTRVTSPKGGFMLWIELPDNMNSVDIFYKARKIKISIVPSLICSSSGITLNRQLYQIDSKITEAAAMYDSLHKHETEINSLLEIVRDVHENLPFNRLLGLKVDYLETDGAGFSFSMKDELVGNFVLGILHGGVISAVLDATGGLAATASAVKRMQGLSLDEITHQITRMGTIDMRIDYLRPGRGKRFLSTATIMRTGRKVAVTRMELKNQGNVLIAVGTGAYIIG